MSRHGPQVYTQCGLRIRSDLPLPLAVSVSDRWDVDVRWGDEADEALDDATGELIAQYHDGQTIWYSITETDSHYLIRFPHCGDFVVSTDLSHVAVRGRRGGRTDLLPILLAGTVSAALLTLRGSTVLHASAVAVDGRVLAVVGHSGQGKSTLAALMCLAGAELVSDDLLTVRPGRPATCLGGASELRLRPAAAHLADGRPDRPSRTTADERRAFAPAPAPAGPLPLAAVVIPEPSRVEPRLLLTPLSASDAMFSILACPRVHGWRRPSVLAQDFMLLGELAGQVPAYRATVPWGPPFDLRAARELLALSDLAAPDGDRTSESKN